MAPYVMLVSAFVIAVIAVGLTRMIFADSSGRGMNASQWLLAAMFWFVMMLLLYIWQRTPFAFRL